MLLDGLHIPLTTPFYPDGRLYLRKLEHNAARYSRTPAAGLAVMTAVGERSLLSDADAREVLRIAIAASAPEKVLTADVSRDSVLGTLELAEIAASAGYDVIAARLPGLLDASDSKAAATYFEAVADRAPLPVLIEDNGWMGPEVVGRLAGHPMILGMVDGAADAKRAEAITTAAAAVSREVTVTMVFAAVTRRMAGVQEAPSSGNYISAGDLGGGGTALATAPPKPAIKTRTRRVGFQRLVGSTRGLLDGLQGGAAGAILPLAAAAPQAVYEVLAAYKDGDLPLAAEKQQRLRQAAGLLEGRLGVAGLKLAADLNGYYGGKPRLPLLPMSGAERAEIEEAMRALRS
jgi:dihydrodipicolinate synthase/N-acetylneuraminate lyase